MKSFVAAAAVFAGVVAAQDPVPVITFGGVALASTTEINYATVSANNYGFWLGRDTKIFCPSANADLTDFCATSNTNSTNFVIAQNEDTIQLLSNLTQKVYVAEGDARFNQAAGRLAYNNGGDVYNDTTIWNGFTIAGSNILKFENQGWTACAATDGGNGREVFARSRVAAGNDCIDFEWLVVKIDNTTPQAFAYA